MIGTCPNLFVEGGHLSSEDFERVITSPLIRCHSDNYRKKSDVEGRGLEFDQSAFKDFFSDPLASKHFFLSDALQLPEYPVILPHSLSEFALQTLLACCLAALLFPSMHTVIYLFLQNPKHLADN